MLPLADTGTWIAVGLAVAAAALALAICLVLLLLVFRRGRAEPAPARRHAEIASTSDLDAVLERTLAAATSSERVDAAMAVVRHSEDTPIVATLGMTAEEASRQPISSSPSGGARSVRISYRYDAGDGPADPPARRLIRGGVAVPLQADHIGTIGTLAVFWRGEDRAPADEEIAALEALARTSAPAIRNAQELREARELADIDALTGVHTRRYFHETLARECARAQRYERGLALLFLDVSFETNDGGRTADDGVLAAVGGRLRGAVRQADVACRLGGERFAVILPEAGARDAENLYRRIQFAVGSGLSGRSVHLSAGIAELRPEDDVVALFQRADDGSRAGAGARQPAERPGGLGGFGGMLLVAGVR
jgi:diguanylate cyclase (GGDEF)-like protein